jgi:hypothetical protein
MSSDTVFGLMWPISSTKSARRNPIVKNWLLSHQNVFCWIFYDAPALYVWA